MGVTIKDVAEAAGVSISTVSKVLNGHYSISEKTVQRVRGIMREMNYYPNANAQSFASGSSHAMTLMAVDLDENGKPTKWMVENSWGPASGYQGHLIMTDEWFDEYMFRLVVETKYASSKIQEILKQKPIRLPAWDPMFAGEE